MILQARFENYIFKRYLVVIPSFLSQIRFVFKTTCFLQVSLPNPSNMKVNLVLLIPVLVDVCWG